MIIRVPISWVEYYRVLFEKTRRQKELLAIVSPFLSDVFHGFSLPRCHSYGYLAKNLEPFFQSFFQIFLQGCVQKDHWREGENRGRILSLFIIASARIESNRKSRYYMDRPIKSKKRRIDSKSILVDRVQLSKILDANRGAVSTIPVDRNQFSTGDVAHDRENLYNSRAEG